MAYSDDRQYINDFNQQRSDTQQSIDKYQSEYDQYKRQSDSAYQKQQEAMQNRVSYDELLKRAQESQGVEQAKQQYQQDVGAVNAINSAMNTLPSTINANSNVVLTNAQRQAALGNQMTKYQNSYDYATREAETSGNLYQQAQNAAFTAAEAGATEQQQNISNAMNAYQQEMTNLQNAYNQISTERQRMFDIYGQKYEEDYRRAQDLLTREMTALENDTKIKVANISAAAQRYQADAGLRLQQYMEQKAAAAKKNYSYGTGIDNTGTYRYFDSKGNEKTGTTKPYVEQVGNTIYKSYVAPL